MLLYQTPFEFLAFQNWTRSNTLPITSVKTLLVCLDSYQNQFWPPKSGRKFEKVKSTICCFGFQHGIGIDSRKIESNPNTL